MKIKLLFLLTAISFCVFAQAQEIHYGITTNLNLTTMHAKGLSGKLQTGYNGGAFATIDFGKRWSLQPEVLYTLKNVQKSSDFLTYYVNSGRTIANTNISLHYISIPVLANYHISDFLTVNAGPEYNVLVYSNENLVKTNSSAFKKGEAGITAGVQLVFSPAFNLFGSYYYGVTNMNNIDNRYQWHSNQIRLGINCRIF